MSVNQYKGLLDILTRKKSKKVKCRCFFCCFYCVTIIYTYLIHSTESVVAGFFAVIGKHNMEDPDWSVGYSAFLDPLCPLVYIETFD